MISFRRKSTRDGVVDAIEQALKNVGVEGIQVTVDTSYRYDDSQINLKVKVVMIGDDGVVVDPDWDSWHKRWGFEKDDIGKVFMLAGRTPVRLTGCKPSRRKYPLSVKRLDTGTAYKCRPDQLTKIT